MAFLHKLLIYAASAVEGKDLAEWDAGYHRGNGELAIRLYEILSLFGFSYSRGRFTGWRKARTSCSGKARKVPDMPAGKAADTGNAPCKGG